jgi:hypothetical protein
MASLSFNANDVKPTASFDPIPAGKYLAAIVESTTKPTKNGAGEYLEIVLEVLEGPYKGRRLWERLTLKHPNDVVVRIASANLSAICHAVAVMTLRDSHELHDIPMTITVALRKREDNGEMVNVVKGYGKREATASAPRTPTAAGGAPWKR